MLKFEIKEDCYLNDKKIKIVSGALHYFRVVPEYWLDRLEKLKALGCNTVETYIPWNFHEVHEGEFDFTSPNKNIVHFVNLAESLGLLVILRPTPYICAEWDFGGLPYWLLKDKNLRIRSNDESFLNKIDNYLKELFKYIAPLQATNGGPVIMMQIENEYGSFGNNKKYLKNIKDIMVKHGATVPLFTSDGGWEEALEAGTLLSENILPTANFGSRTEEQLGSLKNFMEKNNIVGPLICMEFWIGWFNNWGEEFKRRDAKDAAMELDKILEMGHSNIYMFHGGTNFGFYNGCSYHNGIAPQTTSYDYDALLTEWGDETEKYNEFKKVIKKYKEIPPVEISTKIKKINYGKATLTGKTSLFNNLDNLSKAIYNEETLPMEMLNQGYGYILYRSNIGKKRTFEKFKLLAMDDRAIVFINEEKHDTFYNDSFIGTNSPLALTKETDNIMDILVENVGRVNYGGSLLDPKQSKGIKGGIMLDLHIHSGWDHYCLPLDNIENLNFNLPYKENAPAFYEYTFTANELGDSFLDLSGFGKGVAFINGFNLGRFWEIGPTNYLYVPSPLLKLGENKIVIFETEGKVQETLSISDKAIF
ncbi:MAG: glycoside hydrolase family 35 protein [Sarcina sp.]